MIPHMKISKVSLCIHLAIAVMLGFLATASAQVDWTWRAPLAAGHHLRSVAYGSGKFVAVGDGWMTSTDGETWEDKGLLGMTDVAYGNGYFVAVGGNRLLRSLHGNEWVQQPSAGAGLSSLAYGKNRWVLVGGSSIYVSTDDCATITKVTLPTVSGLKFNGVSYGAGPNGSGQFVAVGSVTGTLPGSSVLFQFATFFSSNDGENWESSEESTPANSEATDVVWDGLFNKWLAVVDNFFSRTASPWSSDNGRLWTEVGNSFASAGSNIPVALSYGDGRIAAVSKEQGFTSTSLHGDGWQAVQGPEVGSPGTIPYSALYNFEDLTYSEGLGRWVAVGLYGQIAWSDSPLLWHLGVAEERRATDVGRSLGDFYAVEPARISRSSDGITWTTVFNAETVPTRVEPNPPIPGDPLQTYGTDLFRGIGVSPNELVAVGKDGRILISSNGTTWTLEDNWLDRENVINVVASTNLNHAARGPDGRWVVVGTGGFIGSTASTGPGTWVVRESSTIFALNRIVHTGTAYVAVGDNGAIVTSDNGTAWETRSVATIQPFKTLAVSGSISNPVLVASGAGGLFTSHDHGATWVLRPLPLVQIDDTSFPSVDAVCWAGSEFVGTGPEGVVLVSPDGINWAGRKKGAGFAYRSRAIATDGGIFVMAAEGLLSSPVRTVGPLHTLNITAANGTVTRFPNLPSYETGTVVNLTAQPNANYRFDNFSGAVPFDLRTSINIVVNSSMNITANFTFVPPNFPSIIRPGSNVQNLTSSGNWPWAVEQSAGPTGAVRAVGRSGLPTPSFNTSDLGAFVIGPGTLSFQWKVSTRDLDGELVFFLNDVRHTRITGETGWQKVTVTLGTGFNLLSWRYRPAEIAGAYTDAGFVTDIAFGTGADDFTTWAQALPEGKRGELDRNGPQQLQNLLAYALGLNPLTAGATQIPRYFDGGSNGTWTVRYTRLVNLPDISLTIEYGDTLSDMDPAGSEVTQVLISTTSGVQTWEATLPALPSGKGFFRMVATRIP